MTLDDALLRVGEMKTGLHGLVVADAFGVSALYDAYNFTGEADAFLLGTFWVIK